MELEIRPLAGADRGALRELHRRCAREGLGQAAPDEATWSWLHERSPGPRRVHVAAAGGRILAEVDAVGLRTWIDAREADFASVVGLRLAPELRRGLRRPAPFLALAEALLAPGADRPLVLHGHPDERTLRLLSRRLEVELVRVESLLVRAPGDGPSAAPPGLERIERFDHQARWLYERCSGEWGASTVRDEAWASWRFLDVPGRRYERLGARDGEGILRGWAICGAAARGAPREPGGPPEGNGGEALQVVDWLVPPAEPEVGELLLEGVLALARERGDSAVVALFPEWSPWFERFQRRGFLVHPSGRVLAARGTDRRFDEVWLRSHWWYQPSDDLRA